MFVVGGLFAHCSASIDELETRQAELQAEVCSLEKEALKQKQQYEAWSAVLVAAQAMVAALQAAMAAAKTAGPWGAGALAALAVALGHAQQRLSQAQQRVEMHNSQCSAKQQQASAKRLELHELVGDTEAHRASQQCYRNAAQKSQAAVQGVPVPA